MERLETFNVEPILKSVRDGERGGGRLRNFAENGIRCASCGIEGEFFASERYPGQNPHLNLYAMRDGDEVLMTRDHIIPKSKGGANHIDNYQPMCAPCNQRKDDTLTEEHRRMGVKKGEA